MFQGLELLFDRVLQCLKTSSIYQSASVDLTRRRCICRSCRIIKCVGMLLGKCLDNYLNSRMDRKSQLLKAKYEEHIAYCYPYSL